MSPQLAQGGHCTVEFRCPLLGVKRTLVGGATMSAFDPKRTLGRGLSRSRFGESELESVVATHARQPNCGLIVLPDAFMGSHRAEIAMLAIRYRIPAIYSFTYFAEAGGLISYGVNPLGEFQRAASYGDRILKGAKPSELPVQAPDKFKLVINLKSAKALGLDVPLFLRQRADDVIE